MNIADIDFMSADELAPVLAACLDRLGHLGREGALALAPLVSESLEFDEAASWIDAITHGDI